MDAAKYEESIRRLIVQRNAETTAQRSVIYAAARSSVTKNNPETLPAVDHAIASIEAAFSAPAAAPTKNASVLSTGVAIGIVLGIGAAAIWSTVHGQPEAGDQVAQLQRAYQDGLPQVPVALDFLRKVSDAIIDRQKNDPSSLTQSTTNLVSLRTFDRDLALSQPKSLRAGTSVILRADVNDFKVLMNWPLCGVIRLTNPEMVDPVRTRTNGLGCPYFGLWSTGAAKW